MDKKQPPSDIFRQNLEKYEFGQLDYLPCPHCSAMTVSVYFDGPKIIDDDMWTRIYFFCQSCKQWDPTSCQGIPLHYDERRDIIEIRR